MLINLRNPDATFAQGDEIVGSVVYPEANPSAPFRIVVELAGVVKTKASVESGDSYRTVREEAEILRLLICDIQWNGIVLPFAFHFPWSSPSLDGYPAPPAGQPGREWFPDPLPPSHEIIGGVDAKFLRKWAGSIEYKVRASVFSPAGSTPLQQEAAIIYRPLLDPRFSYELEDRSVYKRDCVKDICVKSLLLLPENKDRKLTFAEKTKSLFQRSSLPHFNFKVIVTHPTRINLGQPLHFVVKLELSPETSTGPGIPEVTLTQFAHTIMGETKVWAQGAQNVTAPTMDNVFCSFNKDLGVFQPSCGYAKTISTPLFTHAIPSFQTKNVGRSYSITTMVHVECAGKAFWWENKSDVTILPAVRGAVLPEQPLLQWSLTKRTPVEWRDGDETQKQCGPPAKS
ncbi:hypothetical protein VUR80DRAFT_8584 [Thermomyces stellatus]